MSVEYPDNWELPTLGFLKNEPLVGGVPRKQAAIAGLAAFFVLMVVNKTVGILAGIPIASMVGGTLFAAARWKYSRNPHWYALMTTHAYPADRWLGG